MAQPTDPSPHPLPSAPSASGHGPALLPNAMDVVMVAPRYAENIGAVARAMGNFGAGRLILVRPNQLTQEGLARRVARAGEDRLTSARVVETLEEALDGYDLTFATSHRHGRHRRIASPSEVLERIVATQRPRRAALVLGPEDHGLKRDEMDLCHHLVSIPSATPLNVAQTAVVLLYEWFGRTASEALQPTACSAPAEPHPATQSTAAQPAPADAIAHLTLAATRGLRAVGYPHHRKPLATEVGRLASILGRAALSALEYQMLMGLFSHLERCPISAAAPALPTPSEPAPSPDASDVAAQEAPPPPGETPCP